MLPGGGGRSAQRAKTVEGKGICHEIHSPDWSGTIWQTYCHPTQSAGAPGYGCGQPGGPRQGGHALCDQLSGGQRHQPRFSGIAGRAQLRRLHRGHRQRFPEFAGNYLASQGAGRPNGGGPGGAGRTGPVPSAQRRRRGGLPRKADGKMDRHPLQFQPLAGLH